MRHLYVCLVVAVAACAADDGPISAADTDAIHTQCRSVGPDAWACDRGVRPPTASEAVLVDPSAPEPIEQNVYGRVYDPPGCHYCGQHSGSGLYDYAPCPWGQTIWRFHCVQCNTNSFYDRILYDCGTPVRATDGDEPTTSEPDVLMSGE